MEDNSLNDLYLKYSQGSLKKKDFEGLIFKIILDDTRSFNQYRWSRDDCMDYFSWLYPRLSRAIDSYKDNGSSFESYLKSLMHWSAKEYHSRRENQNTSEKMVWMARYPDAYTHEDEPAYLDESNTPFLPVYESMIDENSKLIKNPRQLLILILKCYYYCSDDFLDRITPVIGMDKNELRQMVDTLRKQRIRQEETNRIMREHIHSQYYRCIVYEMKLKTTSENSILYGKLKQQLKKARQRLDTMKKRLAQFRLDATNMQIAKILGVKKGTVDSNLYALKSKLRDEYDILPSGTSPQPSS